MITTNGMECLKIVGLPWWLSGKKSACQCRRHGFDPWSRKIPQAVGQPSLCATITNFTCPGAKVLQPESSPRLLPTEKAHTQQ